MEKIQDALIRAYAMLSSLRKNIGQMTDYEVLETYVSKYYTVLDGLKTTGIDFLNSVYQMWKSGDLSEVGATLLVRDGTPKKYMWINHTC